LESLFVHSITEKIRKPNVYTLKYYIQCICILHNILIENDIPVLPEFDVERSADFNTLSGEVDVSTNFTRSREIRKSIAEYLGKIPSCNSNEYPYTY
jgi:hypothetical protein